MITDEVLNELIRVLPIILIKIFTVGLLALHLLFSLIIVRQARIMTKIIEAGISPVIVSISVFHFIISFLVLVWVMLFFIF
ncbi:hypothetical protein A3D05_03835 [Candidatus Gottesmanbacteria bacterium RIFCSPHIGHO2_02_FULL_40_24]|uniref:Uncharacterized protein n=1 Tax=Candidatus Gottesmanbacteria bacterium RIFCSPHIGHO2_01_FULL_40_15 TaxID=1798376 RepID=A0A1F5Z6A9_9BACT|nr:MAG: hypothetical protein A2777_00665 [Candidatus Gottesmanbacteria bacterium RIFCSPHIGHO2_01_FULL_40_15]OGG17541.1 MAG: hypothetical protein A3D05_03835 [Candidatus Gottesmanbacteria bacterium RIFCSPHIGHO2_02_FULL_40_24]OGG20898.1 MAG: hypothetical protein A3B48_05840 [Candidatus Gottesmanbacteria bacterium RIFCSPLOWO2_01_FULL_40_10]OGG24785.1 MAG: hypothetical protein A3E42_03285 [Candidatus Gottesmanbacteria bacterium RIFCSPHIGHO2_12_FULL_40_13]